MTAERIIGRKILRFEQVESTNTLAHEQADLGEAEGLVITAEEQTAGRGRLGRKWLVPHGTSLQCSILLRPPLTPQHATRVMLMATLAVASMLEQELQLAPTLKWPNDVLLGGKKVCGILTESSVIGDSLACVILGIGLNVNYTMRNYPDLAERATTLQDVVGQALDRTRLERALLYHLNHYYFRLKAGESLADEFRARLAMLGEPIRVANQDTIFEGVAEDVDDDGALVLRQDQSRVKLYAGDVTIVKQVALNTAAQEKEVI